MIIKRALVYLVIASVINCIFSHHLRHHNNAGDLKMLPELPEEDANLKNRRGLQAGFYNKNGSESDKDKIPYSYKKLDKMMKKAILQIILGDLHPADMLLLKALNYTLEEVMAIRKHELSRLKEEEELEAKSKKEQEQEILNAKYQAAMHRRSSSNHHKKLNYENNFESYNKQAVYDYENGPAALASSSKSDYDEAKVSEDKKNAAAAATITEKSVRKNFDRVMEPHVVFKVRYDDSEFDSGSDERSKMVLKNHRTKTILKIDKAKSGSISSFQVSGINNERAGTVVNVDEIYEETGSTRSSNLEDFNKQAIIDYENLVPIGKLNQEEDIIDNDDERNLSEIAKKREREFSSKEDFERALNGSRLEDIEQRNESATTEISSISKKGEEEETSTSGKKRVSEYEGLEWVGGDVYRVIPEAMEALLNYEDELAATATAADYENREEEEEGNLRQTSYSSLDDLVNDTFEYQNDAAESSLIYTPNGNSTSNQNLTSYQRLALAQRKDGNASSIFDSQGQKAIEDIKLRVLAMTGRFNLTSNSNQVQRERLTMFSPICQMPRNTDAEAWSDPYSMNMHFQLNLTSGEHVLAAKLRLFKLPQDVVTSPSSSTFEEEEEDEMKIRISVYFYTKSLKKHRAKKRLMDSIVTPLTSQGSHLALDVRQGLRFWRPSSVQQQHSGHSNNSNHGLVVQVEDQDGRPLKPALYIQEPTCQNNDGNSNTDEKTSTSLPFSSEPVLVTFAS